MYIDDANKKFLINFFDTHHVWRVDNLPWVPVEDDSKESEESEESEESIILSRSSTIGKKPIITFSPSY